LHSSIDVGEKNLQPGTPELLLVPSSAWVEYVGENSNALLEVVAYTLYDSDNKQTYVIYFNGVDFIDNKGQRHRTLPLIQAELESMASSLTMQKK
jgi:hypothetical protein